MTKKEEAKELTVDDLPGVGEKNAEKLKQAGFVNLMSIAVAPVAELVERAGLGDGTAQKVIETAREHLKMNFLTGNDFLKKRQTVKRISTGSQNFNLLIGGGVETQAITECFGQYASGKTQIGHQLAVNVQLPKDKGGLGAGAVFIDTEGTFRPERVVQIANAHGIDPGKALENIKVARAYSSDHQMLLAEKIPELIEGQKLPVKLIIIDSLIGLFRSEYSGRGTLAARQQKLNRHIHFLQRLADRYNLAIYVTNQVMSKPDQFFGDPTAPVGGHIVGHACTFRIYLRKGKAGKRVARLIDSASLPEGEAVFGITEEGIRD